MRFYEQFYDFHALRTVGKSTSRHLFRYCGLVLNQTEVRRAKKNSFETGSPLSQGMDAPMAGTTAQPSHEPPHKRKQTGTRHTEKYQWRKNT